jgi:hypothetical protein
MDKILKFSENSINNKKKENETKRKSTQRGMKKN